MENHRLVSSGAPSASSLSPHDALAYILYLSQHDGYSSGNPYPIGELFQKRFYKVLQKNLHKEDVRACLLQLLSREEVAATVALNLLLKFPTKELLEMEPLQKFLASPRWAFRLVRQMLLTLFTHSETYKREWLLLAARIHSSILTV